MSRGYRLPIEVRFWPKVDRRGFNECWPWLAGTHRQGYGKFAVNEGQLGLTRTVTTMPAHRVAFFLVHGRWPEPFGLHGCDNPPCCNAENPLHVHEGTPARNMQEMWARGRGEGIREGVRARSTGRGMPHGADSSSARLTWEQVEEIRARYAVGGISCAALGLLYGVSEMTVSRIVRGLRYVPIVDASE